MLKSFATTILVTASLNTFAQGLSLVDTLVEGNEDVLGLYSAASVTAGSDGRRAYIGSDEGRLVIVDADDARASLEYIDTVDADNAATSLGRIRDVVVSGDDKHLYAAGSRTIAVLEIAETGLAVHSYFEYTDAATETFIWAVALTPDGEHLYAAVEVSGVGQLVIARRDPITGGLSLVDLIDTTARPTSIATAEKHVYVGTLESLDTYARDATTGELTLLERLDNPGDPSTFTTAVGITRDGLNVYSTTGLDQLLAFSRNAGSGRLALLQTFARGDPPIRTDTLLRPRDLAITGAGDRIYVSNLQWLPAGYSVLMLSDIALFERDPTTGLLTYGGVVSDGTIGRDIAVSPDGSWLYSIGTTDGEYNVYEIELSDGGVSGFHPEPFLEMSQIAASVLPFVRTETSPANFGAFATVQNASDEPAQNCRVELPPGLPPGMSLSTYPTDPMTNEIISGPSRFDLPPGGLQTLAMFISSYEILPLMEVQLLFYCTNAEPPTVITGVNSLFVAGEATPVADIIAIAATPVTPGVVETDVDGETAFVVATFNAGATATLRAVPTTDLTTVIHGLARPSIYVPVGLRICETDPLTSVCKAPPEADVEVTIATGATPTFGVFVAGQSETVPLDPATRRIYVVFVDEQNIVRGGTSVAVTVTN